MVVCDLVVVDAPPAELDVCEVGGGVREAGVGADLFYEARDGLENIVGYVSGSRPRIGQEFLFIERLRYL